MIARVEKLENQAFKLVISIKEARFQKLEHNDTVEIEIRKVVKE